MSTKKSRRRLHALVLEHTHLVDGDDDLKQAGLIGLSIAIQEYRTELGPFEPYALRRIRTEQAKVVAP